MRILIRFVLVLVLMMASSSSLPGQTTATSQIMRAKLGHAEHVLEGLMTGDLPLVAREARSLAEATKAPGWAVLEGPRYSRDSETFRRAAEDLAAAAGQRDGEAAVRAYLSMTLSCYQCHSERNRQRIAR